MVDRRSPTSAPTRDLLAHFDALHVEFLGERAVINGGKDAKIVAELFHSHGLERVKELMRMFFEETDDAFILSAGYTVGVFKSRMAGLMARSRKSKPRLAFDWWEDCKARHGGTCDSQYTHGLKAGRAS